MTVLPQRPLRGSRISTFYPVKSLPSLSSLDSAFQLQEYISLLIRLDVHDVEAIVSLPGKLAGSKEKEKEKDKEKDQDSQKGGEKLIEEGKEAQGPDGADEKKTAAGEDNGDGDKKETTTVDEACWIYEQLRRLAQDLSHPLITMLQQECNRASCPEMKAGEWLYLCVAHGNEGAMEVSQCCAIDYILHTLDSATALLNTPRAFPSRLQIPPTSHRHFSSLARRLGRIFAHAYFHHREVFEQAEAESSLYARFLALTAKFDLVPPEFLVIPQRAGAGQGAQGQGRAEQGEVEVPRLLAAAVEPRMGGMGRQGKEDGKGQGLVLRGQEDAPLSSALSSKGIQNQDTERAASRSPPQSGNGSGGESPRKMGRSRTDTMVLHEPFVLEDIGRSNDKEKEEGSTTTLDKAKPDDDGEVAGEGDKGMESVKVTVTDTEKGKTQEKDKSPSPPPLTDPFSTSEHEEDPLKTAKPRAAPAPNIDVSPDDENVWKDEDVWRDWRLTGMTGARPVEMLGNLKDNKPMEAEKEEEVRPVQAPPSTSATSDVIATDEAPPPPGPSTESITTATDQPVTEKPTEEKASEPEPAPQQEQPKPESEPEHVVTIQETNLSEPAPCVITQGDVGGGEEAAELPIPASDIPPIESAPASGEKPEPELEAGGEQEPSAAVVTSQSAGEGPEKESVETEDKVEQKEEASDIRPQGEGEDKPLPKEEERETGEAGGDAVLGLDVEKETAAAAEPEPETRKEESSADENVSGGQAGEEEAVTAATGEKEEGVSTEGKVGAVVDGEEKLTAVGEDGKALESQSS